MATGETCQDVLRVLLAETSTEAAEFGLVVACYTLQHPGDQTERSLAWAHLHLLAALEGGLSLEESRRLARARFDRHQGGRAPPPAPRRRRWRMTIHDLAGRPTSADLLLAWARAILEDLAPVGGTGTAGDVPGGGDAPDRPPG
jgi:hypothetical protein